IEPEGEGRTGQLEAFEDYLFDQMSRGRRALLIMDEAQNLPGQTLEELRMLSNLDYDGTPLFQVFLVGQPEFRETLADPAMEQLKQRVIASYHLENLTEEETREYILHRLTVAGWRQDPSFSDEAFLSVYKETDGRPRRINTLCNRLMLYCSLEKSHEVTGDIVREVIEELHSEKLGAVSGPTEQATPPEPVKAAGAREDQSPNARDAHSPVVVPIDKVRREAKSGEGTVATAPRDLADGPDQDAAAGDSGGSVFDRLRRKRGGDGSAATAAPRQEATLQDVASAIAAASNNDPTDQTSEPSSSASSSPASWRTGAKRALDDAREDLKQVHAKAARLRRMLDETDQRRRVRNAEAANALSAAQTLLAEVRRSGGA
ncbi:MAG: ExeA family protein, partial [Hyphococcus sp.]